MPATSRRALGLLLVARQQLERTAGVAQPAEDGAPIILGPQFVVAAGRRHDHRVAAVGIQMVQAWQFRRIQAFAGDFVDGVGVVAPLAGRAGKRLQPEIGLTTILVSKGQRRQFALTNDRGLPELHPMADVVEQRCQRFPRGTPIQAMAHALRLAHQPGGFQQSLHIQHDVVPLRAQALFQRLAFGPHLARPPGLAPPSVGHLDDLVDSGVPRGDFSEGFFGDPVDFSVRHVAGDVGNGGQHVHQIA